MQFEKSTADIAAFVKHSNRLFVHAGTCRLLSVSNYRKGVDRSARDDDFFGFIQFYIVNNLIS